MVWSLLIRHSPAEIVANLKSRKDKWTVERVMIAFVGTLQGLIDIRRSVRRARLIARPTA